MTKKTTIIPEAVAAVVDPEIPTVDLSKLDIEHPEETKIELGTKQIINHATWKNNLLVGTATTGLVRVEWVQRRYNQIIPTNWSMVDALNFVGSSMPLRFQVSDAQNLIVKGAIDRNVEWLWFIEHDNVLPQGAFIMMNKYMREKKVPVISGLYFTKSVPPEPLLYRGDGHSFYSDWKLGDRVWVSGIPTGCVLIHMSLLRAMWNESPEYVVSGEVTRRVFEEPSKYYLDADAKAWRTESGTSDLAWCKRVIQGHYFAKAGWPEYDNKPYPFLVDTNIFTYHIDPNGRMFPLEFPKEFLPEGMPPPTPK